MRKIYLAMLVAFIGIAANAANTTVTVTQEAFGFLEGYNVSKVYDFVNWTINGEAIEGEWAMSTDPAGFKANNWADAAQVMYQCKTEGLTNLYSSDYGKIYARTVITENGKACGIFNGASGGRAFSIADLKASMIIAIQGGSNDNKRPWTQTYLATSATEFAVEVTDSIHAIQQGLDVDGDGAADGTNDNLRYFKMIADGRVDLVFERSNWIAAYAILTDATMKEYVSSPVLKLVKVNEESRSLEVKVGESSLGNAVTTWYSTDGSDPIFMEETEEIASKDTIFVIDEATGEPALDEEGNKIVESITVNYVKVPVFNEEFGVWGDYEYVPGDEATIDISSADDEDGDGFVTVKIACITADGVMSEIVETNVSVGTITLNAPTLTLVGMDGTSRNYQIGWTNNTLCGEEFMISYETAEDGMFENVAIGDIVSSSEWITVTVSANGYADGVADLQELDNEGFEYARKNTENAGNSVNDWEFQNLTEEQYKMIRGQILDYAYFVTTEGDTTKFTAEEYTNGEVDIPEGTVEVYKHYGWWWDGGSNDRATLGVLMDTVWTDTTMVDANGEMVDTTVYVIENVRYEDEFVGLFHSGLSIDCPPNAKNNSCIMMYCDLKPELGLYMMSKSTINIEGLQYGEYVTMSLGTGGSNYVNNTWTSCDMNTSVDGMFSKTLSAGTHVLNINVYTSENLPDAIEKVVGNKANYANVYSIDGRMVRNNANVGTALNGLEKGIYIMNGKKYLVK